MVGLVIDREWISVVPAEQTFCARGSGSHAADGIAIVSDDECRGSAASDSLIARAWDASEKTSASRYKAAAIVERKREAETGDVPSALDAIQDSHSSCRLVWAEIGKQGSAVTLECQLLNRESVVQRYFESSMSQR
ncbi:hypothetical protein SD72_02855 [Leucobacter komagatae]|uniref:Uncharacterized protein n=1 Tax=Leucobacter komagatae TaxID=55969 RepID=A0A0D0IRK4_9MICO|nr:hypothetical protein SD72_02855 [Leucobacter komagatae]